MKHTDKHALGVKACSALASHGQQGMFCTRLARTTRHGRAVCPFKGSACTPTRFTCPHFSDNKAVHVDASQPKHNGSHSCHDAVRLIILSCFFSGSHWLLHCVHELLEAPAEVAPVRRLDHGDGAQHEEGVERHGVHGRPNCGLSLGQPALGALRLRPGPRRVFLSALARM